jgi:Methyltransferase domain
MLAANAERTLTMLQASDVVVDIGGWAQPFTRANYVVDLMPYDTRGIFGTIGTGAERFTRETWLNVDICSQPLPFADKSVDFVVCSHTLEDIRDPIHVCREMNRVARRGYIEVPSRRMESIWSLEHKGYPGYYHHHWLVEVEGDEITFRFKTPLMNSSWQYTFPRSYARRLAPEDRVSWMFWDGSFRFREVVVLSEARVAEELAAFIRRHGVYPAWRYAAERLRPNLRQRVKRALKRTTRFRALADRVLGRKIVVPDEDRYWASLGDHESR